MTGRRRDLPDQSARCLTCACENRENHAATELLAKADALSATGVVAAIFLAGSTQHLDLTERARSAIAEQREWCDRRGPFRMGCPIHVGRTRALLRTREVWHNPCAKEGRLILRAAKRRARLDRTLGVPPAGADLENVAASSRYVGSPEHKDAPTFAGHPRPRADASICDQGLDNAEEITRWLRQAIQKGAFGRLWEGSFPRYVWFKDGDTVYEGRLINQELGQYKGYPLAHNEWPPDIDRLYG